MASRDIYDLSEQCRAKCQVVQSYCRENGVDLLIYCTLRSLGEQAMLYRQSRPRREIERKMDQFYRDGFEFLAEALVRVGPQYGPHVTNAGPGESWHNYAEAFDAVPMVNGKAVWSYDGNEKLWNTYGESVRQAGMNWAGDWKQFKEYPHAQLREGGNPLKYYSPNEVYDMLMEKRLL